MRNLLNFLVRYSAWFIYVFYAVLSCILLFRSNPYHTAVWYSSANSVTGAVNEVRTDVTGYFNLKETNSDLMERNARLENELENLKEDLKYYQALASDSLHEFFPPTQRFDYETATVINNSTRHQENYITINKGASSGIKPGMGVADHNGVIGIVDVVAPNTSRVISVLFKEQMFTAKLKNTEYVGSLTWPAADPHVAYLTEIPRHAAYSVGDTVITSGYSTTFPEGLVFGIVQGPVKTTDDNYVTLKVRLKPDFANLRTVRVIKDSYKEELDTIINRVNDPKKSKKHS